MVAVSETFGRVLILGRAAVRPEVRSAVDKSPVRVRQSAPMKPALAALRPSRIDAARDRSWPGA